jgi:citrate/tricarballylate utilization protein
MLEEAQRQFTVCNACRYCQDYCAVFPAMETRSMFAAGDLGYLATVCHDCRACYQACMYTEPHEFAINIPALMSAARVATYERYARPRWLARLFGRGPLSLAAVTFAATGLILLLWALLSSGGRGLFANSSGRFYDAISHVAMLVPALLLGAWAITVCGTGVVAYWQETGGRRGNLLDPRLWIQAAHEVLALRWMRGGGAECHFPDEERPTPARRYVHGMVFGGFTLTFAATTAAAVQEDLLGLAPPYPWLSAPVMLGLTGGVLMTTGTIAFMRLKARAPQRLAAPESAPMDWAFLWSLLLVSATGLALFALRETHGVGLALIVHLGAVLAFYLTAPYGKLVHALYRSAAVLRNVDDRRTAARLAEPLG